MSDILATNMVLTGLLLLFPAFLFFVMKRG